MNACMHVLYSSTANIANSYMHTLREAFEQHEEDYYYYYYYYYLSTTKSSCNGGND